MSGGSDRFDEGFSIALGWVSNLLDGETDLNPVLSFQEAEQWLDLKRRILKLMPDHAKKYDRYVITKVAEDIRKAAARCEQNREYLTPRRPTT